MSRLAAVLDEYLAVRRALGYKLLWQGRLLQQFVKFAENAEASYITTDLALKWATQTIVRQTRWGLRLGVVRRFAKYCRSHDVRTVVPPPDLLPQCYRRVSPYLYRDSQIKASLHAAKRLPSKVGLRPHTYATLFGLYVATGLRTHEALRLVRGDVDLVQGVLTIRDTKFGKARYVPVHPSTCEALQRYAKRRDRLCRHPRSPSFFLTDRGNRPMLKSVSLTFIKLSRQTGLRRAGDSRGPRILDFRHRLAITTLTNWHRRSIDVERRLPELSTFLGHTNITATQWYLTATPELLRYTLMRVERSERRTRP